MSKDRFSGHAKDYAVHRPHYPPELYSFILKHVTIRNSAWDCATGNGQAAKDLAKYFADVHASDISQQQLENAFLSPNIHYIVSAAESTPYSDNSFDLVTVAQAYHWFDFEKFNVEVLRVCRPGSIVAVWGYGLIQCEYHSVDFHIGNFYHNVIGKYWDDERKHVDTHYKDVPFPYFEIETPPFTIEVLHTIESLIEYLNTWSAVKHFIKNEGHNPLEALKTELSLVWPTEQTVQFSFPLFLRLGEVKK